MCCFFNLSFFSQTDPNKPQKSAIFTYGNTSIIKNLTGSCLSDDQLSYAAFQTTGAFQILGIADLNPRSVLKTAVAKSDYILLHGTLDIIAHINLTNNATWRQTSKNMDEY